MVSMIKFLGTKQQNMWGVQYPKAGNHWIAEW
jgi:hypothetical protein